MNASFLHPSECERQSIVSMCEAIEAKALHIVCTNNHFKFLVTGASGYTFDYTFNLCRWGFARKARNNDHLAMLHKYTPYQGVSCCLSAFLNKAVELGYYKRTTEEEFNGGVDFQMIWLV